MGQKTPDAFINGITAHAGERGLLRTLYKNSPDQFNFLLENEIHLNGELETYLNKEDAAKRDAYFPELKKTVEEKKKNEERKNAELKNAKTEVVKTEVTEAPKVSKGNSREYKMLLTELRQLISRMINAGENAGVNFNLKAQNHFEKELHQTTKMFFPLFDIPTEIQGLIINSSIRAAFATLLGELPSATKNEAREVKRYSDVLGMEYEKVLLGRLGVDGKNTEQALEENVLTSVATPLAKLSGDTVEEEKEQLRPHYTPALQELKEEFFGGK